MNTQEPKCLKLGCSATSKLYYCHDLDSPRCLKCQQPCRTCRKPRNKPLKSAQAVSQISRQCRTCKSKTSKQWLNFSCGHCICTKCVSKSLCALIKQNISKNRINHDYQAISCSCSRSTPCTISNYLEKYCFCCGEDLQERSTYLKYSLKMKISCKKRIMFCSGSFNQGKTFLEDSIYKQLLPQCKKCSTKIEQSWAQSKGDQKLAELCNACIADQKGSERVLKQSKKQQKQNGFHIPSKQASIEQKEKPNGHSNKNHEKEQAANKNFEKQECSSCESKFDLKDLVPVSQFFICRQCHEFQNEDTGTRIKAQLNNKVVPERDGSNKKASNRILPDYSLKFLYQKCQKCSTQHRISQLKKFQQKKLYLCEKCQKENTKSSNFSKQSDVPKWINVPKQAFKKPIQQDKKKEQRKQSGNKQYEWKDKIQSSSVQKAQIQHCIICEKRFYSWSKKIEYSELGAAICEICQMNNKQSYFNQQSSKLHKPAYGKSNDFEDVSSMSRNKSESINQKQFEDFQFLNRNKSQRINQRQIRQKKFNSFTSRKKSLLHFSQNLITKNEKVNYNTEQRKYAPSIIQPQLQQTNLIPQITKQEMVSCFICGYFIQQQRLFTISLQTQAGKVQKALVCPACFYSTQQ